MKKEKIHITKLLLDNDRVNNYTKLMIILSRLNYFEEYYIPNAKLMKMLGIRKHRLIGLLKQLEEDKVISIFYRGRKRFFIFKNDGYEKENYDYEEKKELFDYDWLNDEEWYLWVWEK